MRHARFDVARLAVEGVDLPLKAAYLLVAERPSQADLDWECLAFALDDAPLAQQRKLGMPGRNRLVGGDGFSRHGGCRSDA